MFRDETCFLLATDFDRASWQKVAGALLETCRRVELPVIPEGSRSGNGGHVWFFFEEALPAGLVRKLGAHILTETMEHRPEIGPDSYARFFLNQATLTTSWWMNVTTFRLAAMDWRLAGPRRNLSPACEPPSPVKMTSTRQQKWLQNFLR